MIESPKVVNMDALQSDDLSSNTVDMFTFSQAENIPRHFKPTANLIL